jgi:hypothetical protein
MGITDDPNPCGLLVDLETIPQLFSSCMPNEDHSLDVDADLPDHQPLRINVYPQAFLRKFGHIQANSILPHFHKFVTQVQRCITRGQPENVDSDGDEDGDEDHNEYADDDRVPHRRNVDHNGELIPPAIIASACQFYNELSHRIRPSAALHEVQQGKITAALAGAYACGKQKKIYDNRVKECTAALPHERYNDKIAINDVPRDLRLENIYIVQLDSLKPEKRNGG